MKLFPFKLPERIIPSNKKQDPLGQFERRKKRRRLKQYWGLQAKVTLKVYWDSESLPGISLGRQKDTWQIIPSFLIFVM